MRRIHEGKDGVLGGAVNPAVWEDIARSDGANLDDVAFVRDKDGKAACRWRVPR